MTEAPRLTQTDLDQFIGGQIQVTSKNNSDHHASYRAQIKSITIDSADLVTMEYEWSAFGEGNGNQMHWAFDGRTSDSFVVTEFDKPVITDNPKRILLKRPRHVIVFYPAGDSALVLKENVRQPQV